MNLLFFIAAIILFVVAALLVVIGTGKTAETIQVFTLAGFACLAAGHVAPGRREP